MIVEQKSSLLRADAASVLASLSRSLGELVSHIPGDMRRPTDMQRVLGVDYKLCWQIFNIIRAENPLSVSQHVPGSVPMKKLLVAAKRAGVPEEMITDVENALKEFQDVVEAHSNDRQAFDSMVAFISGGDAAESLTIQHRRNAFRAESQLWGMQVGTNLRQMFVKRNAQGKHDSCYVNAKYGLHRLRRDVMPIVHGSRESMKGGGAVTAVPLDREAAEACGAPLLRDFSSRPAPKFVTIRHSDGWAYSALDSDQVGRKSAVNLIFAGVTRGQEDERDEQGRLVQRCSASYIAPTELGILELFVHRESYGEVGPYLQVFATAAGTDVPEAMRRTQQFVIHENVVPMGRGTEMGPVSEAPRYLTQLKYVFNTLAWNPAEFDVFRVRIQYPILNTSARIVFDVAE